MPQTWYVTFEVHKRGTLPKGRSPRQTRTFQSEADARAFSGHPEMTIDARRKSDDALAFFTTWGAARRATFLHANGIDYVLTTGAGFAARLAPDPALELIDLEDSAALFRVRP